MYGRAGAERRLEGGEVEQYLNSLGVVKEVCSRKCCRKYPSTRSGVFVVKGRRKGLGKGRLSPGSLLHRFPSSDASFLGRRTGDVHLFPGGSHLSH